MSNQFKKNEGDGYQPSPSFERRFEQPTSEIAPPLYLDPVQLSRPAAHSSAIRKDHAVQLNRNGRTFVVGKILYLRRQKPIFHCRLRENDILVKLDAISVAPEVIDHLETLGGCEVHLYAPWEGILYVADVDTIRTEGRLASFHASIGRRYHLPRRFWKQTRLTYKVPFLEEVVTLDGQPRLNHEVPYLNETITLPSQPKPVQAGLFEGVAL